MISPGTLARRVVASMCFTVAAAGAAGLVANRAYSGQHPKAVDFLLLLPVGVVGAAGCLALTGHLVAGNAAGYVQRRLVGAALAFSLTLLCFYGAASAYVRATGGDLLGYRHLNPGIIAAALFGIACARVTAALADAARDGMHLVGLDLTPASPDTISAFMRIVDTVKAFGAEQRRDHQAIYDTYAARVDLEGAAGRAIEVAERSGRVVAYDRSTAWPELDDIQGMAGGSSDVALAVLVRDLLSAADFDLLTRWWAQAGQPLPEPATDTEYAGEDDDGLPIHFYEDGSKRSNAYHPIHQRRAAAELAHILALRGFWMARAITADKLKPWHRTILVKRYEDLDSTERAEAVKEAHGLALVSGRLAEAGGNPEKITAKAEFLGAVAVALLVRDLIGEERFALIVAHWATENLPASAIGADFPQQAIGMLHHAPYCLACALTHIPNIADGVLIGANNAKHAGSPCTGCGETLPGDPARLAAIPTGRITPAAA